MKIESKNEEKRLFEEDTRRYAEECAYEDFLEFCEIEEARQADEEIAQATGGEFLTVESYEKHMSIQQESLLHLFKNFSRNKVYYVDENCNIGIRHKGLVRWYDWNDKYKGYILVGETNSPQRADKRKIPG